MRKSLLDKLNKPYPCSAAIEWAEDYSSAQAAWDACNRGDWMLWLLGKLSGKPGSKKRRPLVLAACECARLSLKYVPKGERRPLVAIETAERWAKGDEAVTLQQITAASDAASYARTETLKQCADIVRKYYPKAPKL